MDLNSEAPVVDRAPTVSTTDSSAPRERPSVRDTIRQSFADARQRDETPDREVETREAPEEDRDTSTQDAATTDRDTDRSTDRDRDTDTETTARTDREEDKDVGAPTSWAKDAKDIWDDVPERARAEIAKREKDMERGVKSLKDKYKEIDDAIAPYDKVISEFGKTRGQAVSQLFSWFDALAKNPDDAFPALINSYKYDPRKIIQTYFPQAVAEYNQMRQYIAQQQQRQNGQVQNGQVPNGQAQNGQVQNGQVQQQQPVVHPQVAAYIKKLEDRLGGLESQVGQQFTGLAQHFEAQNAAKTQEMLDQWASNKPHFQSVRQMMGHLLTPDPNTGVAAIPLRDGRVDLDAAYEAAIYAMPEVRAQILSEQQAQAEAARKAKAEAALKVQQDKAAAARRASGSITTSAPGAEIGRKTSPSKGLSVRESLQQAMKELSDR